MDDKQQPKRKSKRSTTKLSKHNEENLVQLMTPTDQQFMNCFALLERQPTNRTSEDIDTIFDNAVKRENLLSCLSHNTEQLREACAQLRGWSVKKGAVLCEQKSSLNQIVIVLRGVINRVQQPDIVTYEIKTQKKREYLCDLQLREGICPIRITPGKLLIDQDMLKVGTGWLCYAEEDSWLAGINLKESQKIFKKHEPDLSLQPLLRTHTFLSEFTRKEVLQIIGSTVVTEYVAGHKVYRHLDKPTHLYFLIDGEITLQPPHTGPILCSDQYPRRNIQLIHQQQQLCTISQNSIFGEVEWLSNSLRSYSATVTSAVAKLAAISFTEIELITRNRGETLQSFKQWLHQEYVATKENWRESQRQQLVKFTNSQHLPSERQPHKLSDHQADVKSSPRNSILFGKYLHNSRQIKSVIHNEKTIMEMKLRYSDNTQPIISFSNRLFQRSDFPELDTSLRRYENEEKRIKKKLQLPRI